MCNNLFAYLNRHWVPRAKEEDKKDVYDIYRLTLVVWRDEFFIPLRTQVFEAMMGLITRERNGEGVNTQLIRSITDCCVALGLDEEEEVRQPPDPSRRSSTTSCSSACALMLILVTPLP